MQITTNPLPSTGGLLMGFGLQLLASLGHDIEFGSYAHLRLLAEIMQQTSDARLRYLGETEADQHAERLLDPELLRQYRLCVADRTRALSGTTHMSIMDRMGNVAALTVSNGEGNGYVIPGTGVMLNNMLGEEDLNPEGFHRWPTAHRMTSMMAPTILLERDGRTVATGSGGSNRIRTAILQVLLNLVEDACQG